MASSMSLIKRYITIRGTNGKISLIFLKRFSIISCDKKNHHIFILASTARGRLKSTQMTQIMWICTDKNEAYKTKEVYYQQNKNLRSSIKSALSVC
jgi:hypothetical protein